MIYCIFTFSCISSEPEKEKHTKIVPERRAARWSISTLGDAFSSESSSAENLRCLAYSLQSTSFFFERTLRELLHAPRVDQLEDGHLVELWTVRQREIQAYSENRSPFGNLRG